MKLTTQTSSIMKISNLTLSLTFFLTYVCSLSAHSNMETTFFSDSSTDSITNPIDSLWINPNDSIIIDPFDSLFLPIDSNWVDPFDSLFNPNDSIIVDPFDSLFLPVDSNWIDPFDSLFNPNDSILIDPFDSLFLPVDSNWIDPFDSLFNPNDSIFIDPFDSLFNPNDSIWIDPFDSIFNPNDSIFIDPFDSLFNPNDSIWIDPFDSIFDPNDSIFVDPFDSLFNPLDSLWIDPFDSLFISPLDSFLLNDSLFNLLGDIDFSTWDEDLFDSIFNDSLDCAGEFDDLQDIIDSLNGNFIIDLDSLYTNGADSLLINGISLYSGEEITALWIEFLENLQANGTSIDLTTIPSLFKDYLTQESANNLGTAEEINLKVNVYPNPVVDYIQIILPDESIYEMQLIDLSGRLLSSSRIQYDHSLMVSELPSGQYLLLLKSSLNTFNEIIIKK